MLEGLFAETLSGLLGDWIEDIDGNQLRIAFLQGALDLRGVNVRRDAISQFGFPLRVKRGRIGSLHLSVPWANLKSEATKLVIKDVYILLESLPWQPDGYQKRRERAKMRAVDRGLRPIQAKLARGSSDTGWAGMLLQTVLDNLQVKVHNVHLRFEDCTLLQPPHVAPGTMIAAGLFLHSCQAYTTDAQGRAGTSQSSAVVHKTVAVQGLAVYCDIDQAGDGFAAPVVLDSASSFSNQMLSLMRLLQVRAPPGAGQPRAAGRPAQPAKAPLPAPAHVGCDCLHPYPLSAARDASRHARVQAHARGASGWPNHQPLAQVCRALQLSQQASFNLHLSETQLWALASFTEHCVRPMLVMPRPTASRAACLLWWQYVLEYLKQEARYSQLYEKTKQMPWAEKPTPAEEQEWSQLRARLSEDDIVFFEAQAAASLVSRGQALAIRVAQCRQLQYDSIRQSQSVWARIFSSDVLLVGALCPKTLLNRSQVQLECSLSALSLSCTVSDHWHRPIVSLTSHRLHLECRQLSSRFELRYFCGAVEAIDHFTVDSSCPHMVKSTEASPEETGKFLESVEKRLAQLEQFSRQFSSEDKRSAEKLRIALDRAASMKQHGWCVEYQSSAGEHQRAEVLWYSTDTVQFIISPPCIKRISTVWAALSGLELYTLRQKAHARPQHTKQPLQTLVTICIRVPVVNLPLTVTDPHHAVLLADAQTLICTTHQSTSGGLEQLYLVCVQGVGFHVAPSLDLAAKAPLCAEPFDCVMSVEGSNASLLEVTIQSELRLILSQEHYQALAGILLSLHRVFADGSPREVAGSASPGSSPGRTSPSLGRLRPASCRRNPRLLGNPFFVVKLSTCGFSLTLSEETLSVDLQASIASLSLELQIFPDASTMSLRAGKLLLRDLNRPHMAALMVMSTSCHEVSDGVLADSNSTTARPELSFQLDTISTPLHELAHDVSIFVQPIVINYSNTVCASLFGFLATEALQDTHSSAADHSVRPTVQLLSEARARSEKVGTALDAVDTLLSIAMEEDKVGRRPGVLLDDDFEFETPRMSCQEVAGRTLAVDALTPSNSDESPTMHASPALTAARSRSNAVSSTLDAVNALLSRIVESPSEHPSGNDEGIRVPGADGERSRASSFCSMDSGHSELEANLGYVDNAPDQGLTKWSVLCAGIRANFHHVTPSVDEPQALMSLRSGALDVHVIGPDCMFCKVSLDHFTLISHMDAQNQTVLRQMPDQTWLTLQYQRPLASAVLLQLERMCLRDRDDDGAAGQPLCSIDVGSTTCSLDKVFIATLQEFCGAIPRFPCTQAADQVAEGSSDNELAIKVRLGEVTVWAVEQSPFEFWRSPPVELEILLGESVILEFSFSRECPVEEDGSMSLLDPIELSYWLGVLFGDEDEQSIDPTIPDTILYLKIGELPPGFIRIHRGRQRIGKLALSSLDAEFAWQQYGVHYKVGIIAGASELEWRSTVINVDGWTLLSTNCCRDLEVEMPPFKAEDRLPTAVLDEEADLVWLEIAGEARAKYEPVSTYELSDCFLSLLMLQAMPGMDKGFDGTLEPSRIPSSDGRFILHIQVSSALLLVAPEHDTPLPILAVGVPHSVELRFLVTDDWDQLTIKTGPFCTAWAAMAPPTICLRDVSMESLDCFATLCGCEAHHVFIYTVVDRRLRSRLFLELQGVIRLKWVQLHVASLWSLVERFIFLLNCRSPPLLGTTMSMEWKLAAPGKVLVDLLDHEGVLMHGRLSQFNLGLTLVDVHAQGGALSSVDAMIQASQLAVSSGQMQLGQTNHAELKYEESPRSQAAANPELHWSAVRCTLELDDVLHVQYAHTKLVPVLDYVIAMVDPFWPKGFLVAAELACAESEGEFAQLKERVEALDNFELQAAVSALRSMLAVQGTPDVPAAHLLEAMHVARLEAAVETLISSGSAALLDALSPRQVSFVLADKRVSHAVDALGGTTAADYLAVCAVSFTGKASAVQLEVHDQSRTVLHLGAAPCAVTIQHAPRDLMIELTLDLDSQGHCSSGIGLVGDGQCSLQYHEELSERPGLLMCPRVVEAHWEVTLGALERLAVLLPPGAVIQLFGMVRRVVAFNKRMRLRSGEQLPEHEAVELSLPRSVMLRLGLPALLGMQGHCAMHWLEAARIGLDPVSGWDLAIAQCTIDLSFTATQLLPSLGLLNLSRTQITMPGLRHARVPIRELGSVVLSRWWIGTANWLASLRIAGRYSLLAVRLVLAFDWGIAAISALVYAAAIWSGGSATGMLRAAAHTLAVFVLIPCLARAGSGRWSTVLPKAAGLSVYLLGLQALVELALNRAAVVAGVLLGLLQWAQCVATWRGAPDCASSSQVLALGAVVGCTAIAMMAGGASSLSPPLHLLSRLNML